MIIDEKILREMRVLDLTLSIRPVREIPNGFRISVRNDEYVCSSIVETELFINDIPGILEFLIDKFKY